MADTVEEQKEGTPLKGTGRGYFHPEGDYANPNTYKLTPKYTDPHAKGEQNKLARLYVPDGLHSQLKKLKGKLSTFAAETDDIVLSQLGESSGGYLNFFLQRVDEVFDDKFQIMETMGDSYVAFGLGQRPRVFQYGGHLMNTVENDWRIGFIHLFQQYVGISRLSKLKGTSVENYVTLRYDSVYARGAILNLRTSTSADQENVTPFSFTMLVTDLQWKNTSNLDKTQATDAPAGTSTNAESTDNKVFAASEAEAQSKFIQDPEKQKRISAIT